MTNPRATLKALRQSKTVFESQPSSSILESFDNSHPHRPYRIEFDCPEFTSICPITGQPDFGHIRIRYVPNRKCLESKSLKLYLFSFRNHGAFHERVINTLLDDLVKAIAPHAMEVTGIFNRRGGISINVAAQWPARIRPQFARLLHPATS